MAYDQIVDIFKLTYIWTSLKILTYTRDTPRMLSGVLQNSGYATDLMDIARNEGFRSLETHNTRFCVINVRTSSH